MASTVGSRSKAPTTAASIVIPATANMASPNQARPTNGGSAPARVGQNEMLIRIRARIRTRLTTSGNPVSAPVSASCGMYSRVRPAANPTFQVTMPSIPIRGWEMGRPVMRGVTKKIAPNAALVSQPHTNVWRNPAATVSGVSSKVRSKGRASTSSKLDTTSWRAAKVPSPVAVRSQSAPNAK